MSKVWIMFVPFVFWIGLVIGSSSHPYERCEKKYSTPDDISECIWLLQND